MQPKKFALVEGKSQMHIFLGSRDRGVQPVIMLIGDRTWHLGKENPQDGAGATGKERKARETMWALVWEDTVGPEDRASNH